MDWPDYSGVTLPAGATFAPDFLPQFDQTPNTQYTIALDAIAPGVSDLATEQAKTSGTDWIDSLSRLIGVLAVGEQQRRLLAIQVDRAKQGLPPLDTSQYAPTVRVNAGLSSDTKWLIGALGIGFVAMLALKRR